MVRSKVLFRRRRTIVVAAAALFLTALSVAPAPAASPLIGRRVAARLGLERAWFIQLGVDPGRSVVSRWLLTNDRLFGVTTAGAAFAIDSATGERLWVRQISPPGRAAFGPSANSEYVAVVSGSKLYLLDREDGRTRWIRDLGSAPGAGPALSETYGFVAMVTGRIEGYELHSPDAQPWYYQSKGRTYLQPTTTGRVVTWPTNLGYLYVSRSDEPKVLYRLETGAEIVASPAKSGPYLFVASLDGYLYCIDELSGGEAWRFSTGYPINDAPAVVGDYAFVGSSRPALHSIDVETGAELWQAIGYSQFVARGKSHVYAADRYGNLGVLDAQTGEQLARLPVAEGIQPLVNDQTDRIYLINNHGLVQCLHEVGVEEPIEYKSPFEVEPAPTTEGTPDEEAAPASEPPPPAETDDQPTPEEPAEEEPDVGTDFFEDFFE